MPDATPSANDRQADTLDTPPATLEARELEQLAEIVYRLLRQDIVCIQERRGETPGRWR